MDHGRGARGRGRVWRWAVHTDVRPSNRDGLADSRRRSGVDQNGHERGPERLRRNRGRVNRHGVVARIAGAHRPPSSQLRHVHRVVTRV